jgi:hypothetical protein
MPGNSGGFARNAQNRPTFGRWDALAKVARDVKCK